MPYDLFFSYSRRDNGQGRITQLKERLEADHRGFVGASRAELWVFFDKQEILGMEDWRHRILGGLRESRLLLVCLSPAYLESEYCAWEFNEYLNHEIARALLGEGVAPVYLVDVPGWEDRDFETRCAEWVKELRRRQYVDLRPWFHDGELALHDATVRDRMDQLNRQIHDRLQRINKSLAARGNVDRHNEHFQGRTIELRRLREQVGLGKVGVLTAVHGLGGMGKTALATEFPDTHTPGEQTPILQRDQNPRCAPRFPDGHTPATSRCRRGSRHDVPEPALRQTVGVWQPLRQTVGVWQPRIDPRIR